MELLFNNKNLLSKIQEKKIFPSRGKESYSSKTSVNMSILQKETYSTNILDNRPQLTKEELALYIATLSRSFINREIRKVILNANLLKIIQDDKLVNMIEMIRVED